MAYMFPHRMRLQQAVPTVFKNLFNLVFRSV